MVRIGEESHQFFFSQNYRPINKKYELFFDFSRLTSLESLAGQVMIRTRLGVQQTHTNESLTNVDHEYTWLHLKVSNVFTAVAVVVSCVVYCGNHTGPQQS